MNLSVHLSQVMAVTQRKLYTGHTLTTRAPTIADGLPHTQTQRPAQPTRGLDLSHLVVSQD